MANCNKCSQVIYFMQDGTHPDGRKKWIPMDDKEKTIRHQCPVGGKSYGGGRSAQGASAPASSDLAAQVEKLQCYVETLAMGVAALLDDNLKEDGQVLLSKDEFWQLLDTQLKKGGRKSKQEKQEEKRRQSHPAGGTRRY